MKKYFVNFLVLSLLISAAASCVTKYVWNRGYYDKIKQFLVSRDGQYIVFLGKKYHYIFSDNSDILKEVLAWRSRDILFLNTKESKLELDIKNHLSGYITIECFFSKIKRSEWVFLQAKGFKRDKFGVLKLKLPLQGKRYLPREDLGKSLPSLHRSYKIFIRHIPSKGEKIGLVALTPITATIDGILISGRIILAPFMAN